MRISEAGLSILKLYEQGPDGGPALIAYKCPAGVWTLGWGHTHGVKKGDTCTIGQAKQWLLDDCRQAEDAVNTLVHVPLTQNQFDALVCFVFNIGLKQFLSSTLLAKLNSGDYEGAALEFPRWNKSKGRVLNGLVARRYDEQQLFLTGLGD